MLVLAVTIFGGLYAVDWLSPQHVLSLAGPGLAWLALGLAISRRQVATPQD